MARRKKEKKMKKYVDWFFIGLIGGAGFALAERFLNFLSGVLKP
jgi:aspartyl/asparaginyl-tRNA synthetase